MLMKKGKENKKQTHDETLKNHTLGLIGSVQVMVFAVIDSKPHPIPNS